jgi:hypothetical protein
MEGGRFSAFRSNSQIASDSKVIAKLKMVRFGLLPAAGALPRDARGVYKVVQSLLTLVSRMEFSF